VENLSPETSQEKLQLFFESKKSGGTSGGVERVERMQDENKAIIYFSDTKGQYIPTIQSVNTILLA
jgi:hypothetical protein